LRLKLAGAAACAVAVALAIAAVGTAASSKPTTKSAVTTLHLVEIDHSFNLVDNPPKVSRQDQEFSPGDGFVFSAELRTMTGKHAGWLDATCSAVTGGRNAVTACTGAFRLAGGELIAAATVAGDHKVTSIAIIGGTGAYAGVRGQVRSVSIGGANSNRSNDTLTFWQ
jgi:hypothetical protein